MSKIKDIEKHRVNDLARCALTYLLIQNCPGGRPIVNGFICPHCSMDTSFGDCDGVIDFQKREDSK